jgi:hypothetical protein
MNVSRAVRAKHEWTDSEDLRRHNYPVRVMTTTQTGTQVTQGLKQPGVASHTCNPCYSGSRGRRILSSRPARTKLGKLSQKLNTRMKVLKKWLKW